MPNKFVPAPGLDAKLLAAPGVANAVHDKAEDVEQEAKNRVPVDTGRLKDSIRVEMEGPVATVVADTDYAAFVELGTFDTPAQPFLRPALEIASHG